MMRTYEYWCDRCKKSFEEDHQFGKAPKTAICGCGKIGCEQHYGNMMFILKGPTSDWPTKSARIKRQQTEKNEAAGRRMRGTWDGSQPKLVDQT